MNKKSYRTQPRYPCPPSLLTKPIPVLRIANPFPCALPPPPPTKPATVMVGPCFLGTRALDIRGFPPPLPPKKSTHSSGDRCRLRLSQD
ncbi:hypothetical protein LY76DRAFT_174801 [Colletotrichum caudatum]|nr:hypothetical protein LY76DRAFT_174801 [Colletotrichum caudatum]